MAFLWEHLDRASKKRVADAIENGVLQIEAYIEKSGHSTFTPHVDMEDYAEIAESVCRAVHIALMAGAKKIGGLPKPYTHISEGYITDLLREILKGAYSDAKIAVLAGYTAERLASNRLARKAGKGKSKTWYLRPWPKNFKFRVIHSRRDILTKTDEAKMKKRVEKEGDKPVSTKFDPTIIPPPDLVKDGPQALVEYVRKLVECFRAARDAQVAEREARLREIGELHERLEKAEAIAVAKSGHVAEATKEIVDLVRGLD